MNIGDVIESSIWLDGTETKEQRHAFEQLVIESITQYCQQNGFIHDHVIFTEKRPGEDRVPSVPKHIEIKSGSLPDIRLLVAESIVISKAPSPEGSFVLNLEAKDVQRLRAITRNAYRQISQSTLTDAECDAVIEEIGPEAAINTLRQQTVVSRYH